ncbi:MAG: ABC transporter transmembrane region 2-domain-containing protein, partial [Piptocephalis tieghemiana]
MTPELDYPDQRIAQDAERWAFSVATILKKLALSPVLIAYYTYECWDLSGPAGPGIIYAFFIFSAIVSKFAMSPVVRAIYARERQEGAFRYQHTRVLNCAEAIAFHRGESRERRSLDRTLQLLLYLQRRIIHREFLVNLISQSTNYFGSILSYLIVALPIFTGKYDDLGPADLASVVSKNSFITMYLIFRFTSITDMATVISDLAGYTARISRLLEEASRSQKKLGPPSPSSDGSWGGSQDDSPAHTPLINDLTVSLAYGEDLYIEGPNGVGKTSLLRAISGIWPFTAGKLTTSGFQGLGPEGSVHFLPQSPYLPLGSLWD